MTPEQEVNDAAEKANKLSQDVHELSKKVREFERKVKKQKRRERIMLFVSVLIGVIVGKILIHFGWLPTF
ncbi:MAG: hypothetical protein DWQ19_12865 [Crenarchaeota archaeon]|nr:MAG: hypothetical protein DWQ19_12865 [Thermoproteota archaeon]